MEKLLNKVNTPADIKSFSMEKLNLLSKEIRDLLIKTISSTGGHLASNLGVVELTVALHYHLDSPRDKIVWDVGHQSYTHKILTGRKNEISTIRQYGGLSGYPKFSESEHDIIGAGHTSTSISSALGLALARDQKNKDEKIYAVIGDGAMTAGMAFEALNNAGHLKTDFNVILNDNEMSISPNVGALSHYLSNLRTTPSINKLKEDVEFLLTKIPHFGSTVSKTAERVKNALKYIFISGILFEEMGFTYLGPIDGHNIAEMVENFKKADRINGPVLLHINTVKGKGYKPAENKPSLYHGVSPFEIRNGESKTRKKNPTFSKIFGQTLREMGENDEHIIGITAAMPEGTGISIFASRFPERTYDVGIAEQHAVTLASGLARGEMKPVVAIYSTFLQRAYDQIIHDICIQNLPVTLAIDRAGIVGDDGETHQGVFDFSFLRPIPNMVIMAPKDENELRHMLYTAVNYGEGPTAIRYPRGEGFGVKLDKELKCIPVGKAELLKKGKDVLVITIGSRVYPALKAADLLAEKGVDIGIINARFAKPLDRELILEEAKNYKYILTVEEQVTAGGFGSAVLELLQENNIQAQITLLGLPDCFITHGKADKMREKYGLDYKGIISKIEEFLHINQEENIWPAKNV